MFIVGDPHFGYKSCSKIWYKRQSDYFKEIVFPYIKQHVEQTDEASILVITGDMFENDDSINTIMMNNVINMFYEFSQIIDIHLIVGNHDTPYKNKNDVNTIKPFYYMKNVHVYDKPAKIETADDRHIVMMPWFSDETKVKEILSNPENHDCYTVGHNYVNGFMYENGMPIQNVLTIEDHSNIKIAFYGHNHKKQVKDNVISVGAPYQMKKSDIMNEPGFYHVVFEGDEPRISFLPNHYSPTYKIVNLPEIMEMKLSDANKFVNNTMVLLKIPSNSDIDYTKIPEVLSGYIEIRDEHVNSKNVDDPDIIEIDESISISDKYVAYMESTKTLKLGKQYIDNTDNIKKAMITLFGKYMAKISKVSEEESV